MLFDFSFWDRNNSVHCPISTLNNWKYYYIFSGSIVQTQKKKLFHSTICALISDWFNLIVVVGFICTQVLFIAIWCIGAVAVPNAEPMTQTFIFIFYTYLFALNWLCFMWYFSSSSSFYSRSVLDVFAFCNNNFWN